MKLTVSIFACKYRSLKFERIRRDNIGYSGGSEYVSSCNFVSLKVKFDIS